METRRKIQPRWPIPSQDDTLSIGNVMDDFIRHQVANARSMVTATSYRNSLRIFGYWLDEAHQGKDTKLEIVRDPYFIENYMMWLREVRHNAESSVAHHKRHLRIFLYWCMDRGYIPQFQIVVKNPQEVVPETYTKEEMEKLLRKPKNKADYVENRDWVIINLMIAVGNRRATIVGYEMKDAEVEDGYLVMNQTKNKRGQRIPMPAQLVNIMKKYIETFRVDAKPSDPLFPNQFGTWLDPNALTHSLAKYNKSRGVNKTGVHLFRHTFAKEWIKDGGGSLPLQKMLGHQSLPMTEKYVRLFSEDLTPFVEKHSPLGNYSQEKESINKRNRDRRRGRR